MKWFSEDSALASDVNGEGWRGLAAQVDGLDHVHAGVLGHAGRDVERDEAEVLRHVETRSQLKDNTKS